MRVRFSVSHFERLNALKNRVRADQKWQCDLSVSGICQSGSSRVCRPGSLDDRAPDERYTATVLAGGIHYCLGARLAMLEMEVALATLFTRLPEMRISDLDDLRWHQRGALRGVESLRVVW